MKDGMSILSAKNRATSRKRREVLYWSAQFGGVEIDVNNSIALLRHKWKGQNVTFKSVR